jgi:hypothetical protein
MGQFRGAERAARLMICCGFLGDKRSFERPIFEGKSNCAQTGNLMNTSCPTSLPKPFPLLLAAILPGPLHIEGHLRSI